MLPKALLSHGAFIGSAHLPVYDVPAPSLALFVPHGASLTLSPLELSALECNSSLQNSSPSSLLKYSHPCPRIVASHALTKITTTGAIATCFVVHCVQEQCSQSMTTCSASFHPYHLNFPPSVVNSLVTRKSLCNPHY